MGSGPVEQPVGGHDFFEDRAVARRRRLEVDLSFGLAVLAVPALWLIVSVGAFGLGLPTAIAVAVLALAHLNGVALGLPQLALVAAFAALNNLVIAGLPNQISLFAAYAPVAIAVGVPIELLPLFLAVDTIPDMFATTANVTADLAVTTVLTEGEAEQASKQELPA